jgi:threonine dehydratase
MRLWKEIEAAQSKIQKAIRMTPMIYSEIFSKLTGKEVFLKLENLQKTGSFKIRGAYYKLSRLDPSMK